VGKPSQNGAACAKITMPDVKLNHLDINLNTLLSHCILEHCSSYACLLAVMDFILTPFRNKMDSAHHYEQP